MALPRTADPAPADSVANDAIVSAKIPVAILRQLRTRAREHGHTLSAEIRAVLAHALAEREPAAFRTTETER